MRRIYQGAVKMANADVLKKNIELALASVTSDNDTIERFMDTIFGVDVKITEIPKVVSSDEGREIRTLIDFDYVSDRVRYKSKHIKTKYFATQEEADAYANNGDYRYGSCKERKVGDYTFSATYTHMSNTYTYLSNWLECTPVTNIEYPKDEESC